MTAESADVRPVGASGLLVVARVALALSALAWAGTGRTAEPEGNEFFETRVRPVLVERCGECHGPKGKAKGGLRLTSRASLLSGGDSGAAAVPGKPGESLILDAIRYVDEPRMPPAGRLSDREIEALTRWVELGLPWPESAAASAPGPVPVADTRPAFRISAEQRGFWAFRPVKAVEPPAVKDGSWPGSAVDRFVLAALESRGLRPAPPADARTLVRRTTYDLTGLPPTPEEVEAFVSNRSPRAYEALVDRLLASPRYGERWGRHWLDLVRYTDSFDARSAGTNSETDINDSWRYRDWVVDALNRDLPYDQFVSQQIAGDILPDPQSGTTGAAAGTIATGLLAIGNWGGGDADKEKLLTDIADDQVDVVSRAFMGLTVACARCHDHKFDPISTRDYYALAGIFFSTHILPNVGPKTNGPPMLRIPLLSDAEKAERSRYEAHSKALEARLDAVRRKARQDLARPLIAETGRYVAAAWEYENLPPDHPRPPLDRHAESLGLRPFALRQWLEALSFRSDVALLGQTGPGSLSTPGVTGWRGASDEPVVFINPSANHAIGTTFKVPARSVTAHPGPASGVGVAWSSPISGEVRVGGRLDDTDPTCGDGVTWSLDLVSRGRERNLARGDLSNGSGGDLTRSAGGPALETVRVEAGDQVRLTVLPKAEYFCDMTRLRLTIRSVAGGQVWDLVDDLTADPTAGNPHPDRLGHNAVWHLLEVKSRSRKTGTDPILAELARVFADPKSDRAAVVAAAESYRDREGRLDATSPFWVRSPADEGELSQPARDQIARVAGELESHKKNPPPPIPFANGAQEGGVPGSPQEGTHDVRVHIRGSYSRLADLVPRRFPVILAGESQLKIASGSGRRELAQWLTAPEHPLTARVMVNRVWQQHFGAGIVRTPSNFGKLGEPPTHPELLDYLARRFVEGRWSLKALHRLILLSASYRQSSEADPETFRADPDNRLFGRMARRRLDAESIRDTLLLDSGRLYLTSGGPPSRDPKSPRRSLYLMTIRSDRSSFGPLFDAADPTAMVDTRTVSTVAPQALYLLNNSFVLDQSAALARRIETEAPGDDEERIGRAYALLFGRSPTDEERQIGLESLAAFRKTAGVSAWPAYCHVLLCTNEWIYTD